MNKQHFLVFTYLLHIFTYIIINLYLIVVLSYGEPILI